MITVNRRLLSNVLYMHTIKTAHPLYTLHTQMFPAYKTRKQVASQAHQKPHTFPAYKTRKQVASQGHQQTHTFPVYMTRKQVTSQGH